MVDPLPVRRIPPTPRAPGVVDIVRPEYVRIAESISNNRYCAMATVPTTAVFSKANSTNFTMFSPLSIESR